MKLYEVAEPYYSPLFEKDDCMDRYLLTQNRKPEFGEQ
jgi:hypothetical protein